MPVISALRRLRQESHKLQLSRWAWTAVLKYCLKNKWGQGENSKLLHSSRQPMLSHKPQFTSLTLFLDSTSSAWNTNKQKRRANNMLNTLKQTQTTPRATPWGRYHCPSTLGKSWGAQQCDLPNSEPTAQTTALTSEPHFCLNTGKGQAAGL